MEDVDLESRSLAEMSIPYFHGLKDPYGVIALTEEKRSAFLHNPFAADRGMHCQAIGVKDGVAIGGEINFPLYWSVRGELFRVLYGSTTFVAKEYRKTALGLRFPDYKKEICSFDITGGAGCSQLMLRMLRYYKEPVFLMPRMIMLFKSRAVVEKRLQGLVLSLVADCVDLGLLVYWMVIRILSRFKLRGYFFETVTATDIGSLQQVADLISADKHPYAELHDVRWLKWHLTESFTKDGPMTLTLVKRNGVLVAFYMTKIRFHEQASVRGFRNVRLGSIMEWQVLPCKENILPWVLMNASYSLKGKVDAVEVVAADEHVKCFLRLCGWQHVGDSNFTFHIYSGPLKDDAEILRKENWRLRPAMGDAGL